MKIYLSILLVCFILNNAKSIESKISSMFDITNVDDFVGFEIQNNDHNTESIKEN